MPVMARTYATQPSRRYWALNAHPYQTQCYTGAGYIQAWPASNSRVKAGRANTYSDCIKKALLVCLEAENGKHPLIARRNMRTSFEIERCVKI